MTTELFDHARAEAFATDLLQGMNQAGRALMISLGHRTGLFDTMAELPNSTSEAIAAAAGLNERYVREWLGAMVTGRVVEFDPATGLYRLPAEHAAFLTRAAADNVAVLHQYFAVLGGVEDGIAECFRQGGGLPYEAYSRFHDVMAEDSGQSALAALESHLIPLVPGLRERLESGIDVVDIGCGQGRVITRLAELFPRSRFTGYDLCREAVEAATAASDGLDNIRFAQKDAAAIDEIQAYDLICTFDAVHDQADPARVLSNIHRALRQDGTYLMQDIGLSSDLEKNIDHPIGTLIYTISCMHCMSVSLCQCGAGLGAAWGVELAQRMLKEAGFSSIEIKTLAHDFQNVYFINRKNP